MGVFFNIAFCIGVLIQCTHAFTAVCVCVRSRAVETSITATPLISILIPSFRKTTTTEDDAHLYVAIDSDDYYWYRFIKVIESVGTVMVVNKTLLNGRIPFNEITQRAQDDGAEYIVRVNDDTEFVTPGWVQNGKDELKKMDPPNVGVVAPVCNQGNTAIFTHDMVHRTHLKIFKTYYPAEFKNWFTDDWITLVYQPNNVKRLNNWIVRHRMVGTRYKIEWHQQQDVKIIVDAGKVLIRNYISKTLGLRTSYKPIADWIVVVTSNVGFEDMLQNWLFWILKLKLNLQIILIAEDFITYKKHKNKERYSVIYYNDTDDGTGSAFSYDSALYKKLVSKRPSHILRVMSKYTNNIIYTDTDTVWLSDPRPFLNGNYDISASLDAGTTTAPYFCTGFMALKNNADVINVLQKWNRALLNVAKLNQPVFNQLLKNSTLSVNVLSQVLFPSGAQYFDERKNVDEHAVIVHNNYIIGKDKKIARFKKAHLWHNSQKTKMINILPILSTFQNWAKLMNITYWVAEGTLINAARHGTWMVDDDIDIDILFPSDTRHSWIFFRETMRKMFEKSHFFVKLHGCEGIGSLPSSESCVEKYKQSFSRFHYIIKICIVQEQWCIDFHAVFKNNSKMSIWSGKDINTHVAIPTQRCIIDDIELYCPADPVGWLSEMYIAEGNKNQCWQTPPSNLKLSKQAIISSMTTLKLGGYATLSGDPMCNVDKVPFLKSEKECILPNPMYSFTSISKNYDEAWVLLAIGLNGYSLSILSVIKAIRRYGNDLSRDIVVFYDNIGVHMEQLLRKLGVVLLYTETVKTKTQFSHSVVAFTKLLAWRLTQYRRVVFMDADSLPIGNIDDIWTRHNIPPVTTWIAPRCDEDGDTSCLHSGTFMIRPSAKEFDFLTRHADWQKTNDQQFLNKVYNTGGDYKGEGRGMMELDYDYCVTNSNGKHPNGYRPSTKIFHFKYNPKFKTDRPWKIRPIPSYESVKHYGWSFCEATWYKDMLYTWWRNYYEAIFDAGHNELYARNLLEPLKNLKLPIGVQMSIDQVTKIRDVLPPDGNLLVWGLGNDSPFWHNITTGKVVFLEDDIQERKNGIMWYDMITKKYPFLVSFKIHYSTNVISSYDQYVNNPKLWTELDVRSQIPSSILDIKWDVIIVDAPLGCCNQGPGRYQSIYTTKLLANNTHIFIDDYERKVENVFSRVVFGKKPMHVTKRTNNIQAHFLL